MATRIPPAGRGAFGNVDLNSTVKFAGDLRAKLNLGGGRFAIGMQDSSMYLRRHDRDSRDGFIGYRGGGHPNGYLGAAFGVGTDDNHIAAVPATVPTRFYRLSRP